MRLCWRVFQVMGLELKSYGDMKLFRLEVWGNRLQMELQQRILQVELLRNNSRLRSLIILSGAVYTMVEVCRMDLEMSGLVEWSWLQLMCCAICLSRSHNFRCWKEVQDGSEYWIVCRCWTLEIKFNKRLSLLIIRLANYSVTTSLIYKQKV